jgi:hypothetical protein
VDSEADMTLGAIVLVLVANAGVVVAAACRRSLMKLVKFSCI